jgi:hypothetical protein
MKLRPSAGEAAIGGRLKTRSIRAKAKRKRSGMPISASRSMPREMPRLRIQPMKAKVTKKNRIIARGVEWLESKTFW